MTDTLICWGVSQAEISVLMAGMASPSAGSCMQILVTMTRSHANWATSPTVPGRPRGGPHPYDDFMAISPSVKTY